MRFFQARLLNGPGGDPALYAELRGRGRSLLFDCGRLHRLRPQQALRLTDLFVSHTHIDHFIGFDHLLRLLLGSDRRLRVWGPPGILGNVAGRLAGYTWNLVDGQTLVVEACEAGPGLVTRKEFHCAEAFAPTRAERAEPTAAPGLLLDDGAVEVSCVPLDHIIPSLAYAVREKPRINIDELALDREGLAPGPWLRALKEAVRTGAEADRTLETPRGPRRLGDLRRRLVRVTPGEKLAYVADSLGSPENLERAERLARGADQLFCEGGFLSEDRAKAEAAHHLTAAQAGALARRAGCGGVRIFHFSPKYTDRWDDLEEEARRAFAGEEP